MRDVPHAAGVQPIDQRHRRPAVGERGDERANLVARQAAGQGDLVDLALLQRAGETDERRRAARQPAAIDDHRIADEADDDRRRRLQSFGGGSCQRVDPTLNQRMGRRVELNPA